MATPKLTLGDDIAETRLFRLITSRVKEDPVLRTVFKTFKDWTDSADDRLPIEGQNRMPAIEFYPMASGETLDRPGQTIAEFSVNINLWVSGLRIDNLSNLWGAVVRSLRPSDQAAALTWQRKLQTEGGAETGQILASRPAFAARPDAANQAYFQAAGQVSLKYYPQKFT